MAQKNLLTAEERSRIRIWEAYASRLTALEQVMSTAKAVADQAQKELMELFVRQARQTIAHLQELGEKPITFSANGGLASHQGWVISSRLPSDGNPYGEQLVITEPGRLYAIPTYMHLGQLCSYNAEPRLLLRTPSDFKQVLEQLAELRATPASP